MQGKDRLAQASAMPRLLRQPFLVGKDHQVRLMRLRMPMTTSSRTTGITAPAHTKLTTAAAVQLCHAHIIYRGVTAAGIAGSMQVLMPMLWRPQHTSRPLQLRPRVPKPHHACTSSLPNGSNMEAVLPGDTVAHLPTSLHNMHMRVWPCHQHPAHISTPNLTRTQPRACAPSSPLWR